MTQKARKGQRAAKQLRDIEGTVRQMMHNASSHDAVNTETPGRVIVGGQGESTYIGATHFMTILDNVGLLSNNSNVSFSLHLLKMCSWRI